MKPRFQLFRQKRSDSKPPKADSTSAALRSDAFLNHAMNTWGDTVYRVALSQTGSPTDADDIYQDVFLRLLKDNTLFSNGDHLKAWLLRVTLNRCHDMARLAWNRKTGPLLDEHASIQEPCAFRAEIWDVVAQLPENLRACIHLYYIEGYSTEEIGIFMDCPAATVRTRLHRAREVLRKTLLDIPDYEEEKELGHDEQEHPAYLGRLPIYDARHNCALTSSP